MRTRQELELELEEAIDHFVTKHGGRFEDTTELKKLFLIMRQVCLTDAYEMVQNSLVALEGGEQDI